MAAADDRLFDKASNGDKRALGQLLEQYGPAVRRGLKIASKWSAQLDADDVMQITYIEAYLRIGSFVAQGEGSFVNWLRRIAQNNLNDAIEALSRIKRPQPDKRVRSRGGGGNSDDSSQQFLMELAGRSTATPRTRAGRTEAAALLRKAIDQLPVSYKRVVESCDLSGEPAESVAGAMGRSRAAIYMIRARAREHLREALGSSTKFFSEDARATRIR